jgi:carbonic anhydrase/acetyltransferase-like protein (isoleucine patch superfamily)
MPEPLILSSNGRAPQLHAQSWVASNATVIGPVTVGAKASVWYGAILRAEFEPIEISASATTRSCTVARSRTAA